MQLSLIAAISHPNRVIGNHNQLPWHMPTDMQYFKETTRGKPVIMGRKTFLSMGRPLPHRQNIIITRDKDFTVPGCDIFHSLTDAMTQVSHHAEVFVIGGAEIYQQALPYANVLYITYIYADVVGDTIFPEWDKTQWQEISRDDRNADAENPYDYSFVVLKRV